MTRPTVTHDGFLIPNASGVAEPVLAEPDQIDFNTLANAKWGVIEGCEVNAQSSKTVAISPGTAIVNGKIVRVTGNSLPLPTPGANAQFVLIVVDASGVLKVREGLPAVDPVFPDPLLDQTVLASVYCDATSGNFANNIVDKRKLLSTAAADEDRRPRASWSATSTTRPTITSSRVMVARRGRRTPACTGRLLETLTIEDNLVVTDITAEDVQATGDINATGLLTASNFRRGTSLPLSANDGDFFVQTSTGNLYIWFDGAWSQLASMSATQGVVPFGTVIYSLQIASVMRPLGWFPMDGTERSWRPSTNDLRHPVGGTITGTAPNRTVMLPDLNRRTMIVDFAAPHQLGGLANNSLTLTTPDAQAQPQRRRQRARSPATAGGHTPPPASPPTRYALPTMRERRLPRPPRLRPRSPS